MDSNPKNVFKNRSSRAGALSPDIVKEPYLHPVWLFVFLGGVYGKEKRQTYKQNNKKIK